MKDQEMEVEESGDDSGYSLSEKDVSKVKQAIAMIEPLASQEGCSVAELIEKVQGGDMDEESEGGGNADKVALIVARMKKKSGGEPSLEG